MNAVLILPFLVAALWIIKIGRGIYWSRRFRRILDAENTRASFTEIRSRAIRLLMNGELAPDSHVFRLVFLNSSAVIRRSNDYQNVAELFFQALTKSIKRTDEIRIEEIKSEMRTDAVKALWKDYCISLRSLIQTYHPAVRLLTKMDSAGVPVEKILGGILWVLKLAIVVAEKINSILDGDHSAKDWFERVKSNSLDSIPVARRTEEYCRAA